MSTLHAVRTLSDPSAEWHLWAEAHAALSRRAYLAPPYTAARIIEALRRAKPRPEVAP